MLNCDKAILVCKIGVGSMTKDKAIQMINQCKIMIEDAFKIKENSFDDSLVILVFPIVDYKLIDIELLNPRYPNIDEITEILKQTKEELENLYK